MNNKDNNMISLISQSRPLTSTLEEEFSNSSITLFPPNEFNLNEIHPQKNNSVWIIDLEMNNINGIPLGKLGYKDIELLSIDNLPLSVSICAKIRKHLPNSTIIFITDRASLPLTQELLILGASWVWGSTNNISGLSKLVFRLLNKKKEIEKKDNEREGKNRVNVLAVDDDSSMIRAIQDWLPKEKYEVKVVNENRSAAASDISIEECLNAYDENSPIDIVIMDMALNFDDQTRMKSLSMELVDTSDKLEANLEYLDGLKAICEIEKKSNSDTVKFLVFSGYTEEQLANAFSTFITENYPNLNKKKLLSKTRFLKKEEHDQRNELLRELEELCNG